MESSNNNLLKYEKEYWEKRYYLGGNSGAGSYGKEVSDKIDIIVDLVKKNNIKTILDVGCGDFNFGSILLPKIPGVKYKGLDISPQIIATNKLLHKGAEFEVFDWQNEKADLVICMDVLFHIIEDEDYEKLAKYLKKAHKKNLVVSQMGGFEKLPALAPHVNPRKMNKKSMFGKFKELIVMPLEGEVTTKDIYIFEK